MAKTRSQTGNITIKKEGEDSKDNLLLNDVTKTTRNRITKRKGANNRNSRLLAQQVKVEEDTDTKFLLKTTPNSLKLPKGQRVSQEQINQLIDAIVNDKMSTRNAAHRAKLSINTARYYYNAYRNDPKKKIPSPRDEHRHHHIVYTPKHIENLIKYIVDDKMSVPKASTKANLTPDSGRYYYNKYLKDPNHNIPIPYCSQYCTQEQREAFIGYIVNDKMCINAASRKAKMTISTGRNYYHKYFDGQNSDIATPSHITYNKPHTQEQKKKVVGYIVNNKMGIAAAAKKANMSRQAAREQYYQYLKNHNMEIPVRRLYTQEEIKEVIGYITNDKMTIAAAAKEVNLCSVSVGTYYRQYLKDHNMEVSVSKRSKRYTQDEINQLIGYIVDDKMSITAASKKANVNVKTVTRHYHQYLKNRNLYVPIRKAVITHDQKNKLISYIIDDKMTIAAASKKTKMKYSTGKNCYRKYRMDQKRDTPN